MTKEQKNRTVYVVHYITISDTLFEWNLKKRKENKAKNATTAKNKRISLYKSTNFVY